MSKLSPGAYKSMRKEVQRYRNALFTKGLKGAPLEMKDDGPYLGGCKVPISRIRTLRRQSEGKSK